MSTHAVNAAPSAAPKGARRRRTACMAVVLAAAALGGVFVLYRQPEFLRMLGDMIWACFG
ncbi:MAG: hypothetical protein DI563_29670 [Variovorax paradoxus]|uniref:Uncharacterized protein n=1 Tax=Variovorax paradoxus TaxID=34073 RepID=A0A2W5P881_VARPD|nr:MAG: hypothetical protein DI563_29670 [Variovorax paradoxus]